MTNYREWVEKALVFLEEAREDIGRQRYWLACFHAQQAAELFLKGVLVAVAGAYPFTHSLVELLGALEELGYRFSEEDYIYADMLEKHYTRARYPSIGLSVYDERTAERCLYAAERLIEKARRVLESEKEDPPRTP